MTRSAGLSAARSSSTGRLDSSSGTVSKYLTGEHRRVDQHSQRDVGEVDAVRGGTRLLERGGELPPWRQLEAGLHADSVRLGALRVEQQLIPADEGEVRRRRRGRAEPRGRAGREEVQGHIDGPHAHRHVEMERVHVHDVAAPRDRLSASRDLQPDQVVNRPGRRVLAGQPLGIDQGHWTGHHGKVFGRVVELTRHVARVDAQQDRAGRLGSHPGRFGLGAREPTAGEHAGQHGRHESPRHACAPETPCGACSFVTVVTTTRPSLAARSSSWRRSRRDGCSDTGSAGTNGRRSTETARRRGGRSLRASRGSRP